MEINSLLYCEKRSLIVRVIEKYTSNVFLGKPVNYEGPDTLFVDDGGWEEITSSFRRVIPITPEIPLTKLIEEVISKFTLNHIARSLIPQVVIVPETDSKHPGRSKSVVKSNRVKSLKKLACA